MDKPINASPLTSSAVLARGLSLENSSTLLNYVHSNQDNLSVSKSFLFEQVNASFTSSCSTGVCSGGGG